MNDEFIVKATPVIRRPACIASGRKQDCFNCELFRQRTCDSPRSKCALPYPLHTKGCPNYGKRKDCPPIIGMLDDYFEVTKPMYIIFYKFPLLEHMQKMKAKHPEWTERQLRNCLYWQGTSRKRLKDNIAHFLKEYGSAYAVTRSPEAMGVDVSATLAEAGIHLEWPPVNYSYKIALAGILKNGALFDDNIFEGCIDKLITPHHATSTGKNACATLGT